MDWLGFKNFYVFSPFPPTKTFWSSFTSVTSRMKKKILTWSTHHNLGVDKIVNFIKFSVWVLLEPSIWHFLWFFSKSAENTEGWISTKLFYFLFNVSTLCSSITLHYNQTCAQWGRGGNPPKGHLATCRKLRDLKKIIKGVLECHFLTHICLSHSNKNYLTGKKTTGSAVLAVIFVKDNWRGTLLKGIRLKFGKKLTLTQKCPIS